MPIELYSRLTARGQDDDDCYSVFDGACVSSIVLFCALAASVVIWKACAFVAMAAALLALGWRFLGPASGALAAGGGREGTDAPEIVGLPDAAIDALPAAPYERPEAAGSAPAPVCSVCLEDFQGGETVRRLPECRHVYHARCIDMWLHLRTTCPLCRSDLSPRRRVVAAHRRPIIDAISTTGVPVYST